MADDPIRVDDLPLLEVLPLEGRQLVLDRCVRRVFPARSVVFNEGEPGEHLYLVVGGRALVRATTPDGGTAAFAIIGAGQTFGELALIDARHRRTGTVAALSELDTLVLGREDFLLLRARYPAVDRLLVEALAHQVERLSRHLLESLFVPVEQRIVRRLIAVTGLYGGLEAGVVVTLTQEDLAGLAGTTRPTVNQTLGRVQEAGGVRLGRGRIEIVDPAIVRRAARPGS